MRTAVLVAVTLAFGCDSGKPSMSDALAQSDAKEKARKEAEAKEKAAVKVKKADPNKLEVPWNFDGMKATLVMGTIVEYAVSGTDAKGKPVEDVFRGEVKGNDDKNVAVLAFHESQKSDPAVTQVKRMAWTLYSRCSCWRRLSESWSRWRK